MIEAFKIITGQCDLSLAPKTPINKLSCTSGQWRIQDFIKGMRTYGVWGDGSPQAGSRGGVPMEVWGRSPQKLQAVC